MSDDDDVPTLPADTLAILQQFYSEQSQQRDAETNAESKCMPEEDWQLSQFWYDEQTSEMLAREALAVAGPTGRIACISCPTMYHRLRQIKPESCTAVILEYDRRFEKYAQDFMFYDYNCPDALPSEALSSFDMVVADPPFLSEECLTKTAQTVKLLGKGPVLLCTGAVMEELAASLLGTKVCDFRPKHTRNLANEFRCYANYQTLVIDKQS